MELKLGILSTSPYIPKDTTQKKSLQSETLVTFYLLSLISKFFQIFYFMPLKYSENYYLCTLDTGSISSESLFLDLLTESYL